MQCIVKCMDIPALTQGGALSTQKVAVKVPAAGSGNGQDSEMGPFADIMAALMQMPTDQLNRSLEDQFAWVAVDGGSQEWMPLIDLSGANGNNGDIIQMLLNPSGENGQIEMPTGGDFMKRVSLNLFGPTGRTDVQTDTTPTETTADAGSVKDSALTRFITSQTGSESAAQGQLPDPEIQEADEALAVLKNDPVKKTQASQGQQPDVTTGFRMPGQGSPHSEVTTQWMARHALKKEKGDGAETDTKFSRNSELAPKVEGEQARKQSAVQLSENLSKNRANANINAVTNSSKNPVSEANANLSEPNDSMQKALSDALEKQRPLEKTAGDRHAVPLADQNSGQAANITQPNSPAGISQSTGPAADIPFKTAEAKVAETAHKEVDMTTDTKSLQTDVIRQIVQRMTMRTDGNQSQMQIRLKPEFLGNVRLEVVTHNHQVTIRMAAENHAVRDMVEQNIHVLKSELEQHGLQIQKFDVFVAPDNNQWRNGRRFQNASDHGRRNGGQERKNNEGTTNSEVSGAADDVTAGRSRSSRGEVDFFA